MSLPIAYLRFWLNKRKRRRLRTHITYSALLRYRQFL